MKKRLNLSRINGNASRTSYAFKRLGMLLPLLLAVCGGCQDSMARQSAGPLHRYKGQLHIHMKGGGDDGTFENVAQVAQTYYDAGYDFICITGHNIVHDSRSCHVPGAFVTFLGVELHNYAGEWLVDNPGRRT